MISHHNVISNVMMVKQYDQPGRTAASVDTQIMLGLLPFSHIYGLVVNGLYALATGDELIVLPRFELKSFLETIQRFRIQQLAIVPPILIQMLSNQELCKKYDLSSVRFAFSGAAPLGTETMNDILKMYPNWNLCQGYGVFDKFSSQFSDLLTIATRPD